MVYCPNPKCKHRQNSATAEICQGCQTSLTLNRCYRLVQPLVSFDQCGNTEIFDVIDLRQGDRLAPSRKLVKILKYNGGDLERLFRQEASHLQVLDHPAIPKIFPEDRTDEGYFSVSVPSTRREVYYFVMEKVEGHNLRDWIQQHPPIDSSTLLKWLQDLLAILDYLHRNKIWHRDIKPSNIMLGAAEQLVLIDFGAVKQVRPRPEEAVDFPQRRDITVTDTCIFAAGYTPPEQIRGKTVQQSDFYALGRTCVHLLTQIPPYDLEEDDSGQLVWREQVSAVSTPLADWIDKLMAPLVRDRPPTAAEVLKSLGSDRIIPPPKPPNLVWVYLLNMVLFSILLISGVLWWQAWQNSEDNQESSQGIGNPAAPITIIKREEAISGMSPQPPFA